jgi:hypothetical protein
MFRCSKKLRARQDGVGSEFGGYHQGRDLVIRWSYVARLIMLPVYLIPAILFVYFIPKNLKSFI